jgi:ribosome-associated protein
MPDEIPSKTKRKQEMHELQALGVALVALTEAQLDFLEPDLREAVLEAKRITAHEGRRRQMQYIGKLMRKVDPAPIRARLDKLTGSTSQANARHKRIEALRKQLLADDEALERFAATHPSADIPALRALINSSRKEYEEGRPPRAYRELFRLLTSIDSAPSL